MQPIVTANSCIFPAHCNISKLQIFPSNSAPFALQPGSSFSLPYSEPRTMISARDNATKAISEGLWKSTEDVEGLTGPLSSHWYFFTWIQYFHEINPDAFLAFLSSAFPSGYL